MKKILSIVCILMLCLPAVAQKKSSSKSSSKKAQSTATYSGSKSSSSSVGHRAGQWGITADVGVNTGNTVTTIPAGAGTQTTDRPNNTTSWSFSVGGTYFVLKDLEVNLGLGYSNTRTFQGLDTDNVTRLYQNVGFFNITPSVGYHVRLCDWLHYVPKLEFGIGFGSVVTDVTFIPNTTRQTGTSNSFYVDLALLNFELLANRHFSLTLDIGGLNYFTQTIAPAPNTKQVTNTFNVSLLNGAIVGFRYYF